MTTLTDLKRAIARVEEYRAMPLHDRLLHAHAFAVAERDAWKAICGWLNRFAISNFDEGDPVQRLKMRVEYSDGMALVRERLG